MLHCRFNPQVEAEYVCTDYKGLAINVVTCGTCQRFGVQHVGTMPAVLATYLAIQELKPDLIVSAGTAGGFKVRGGNIADVYVSTVIMHHDR